MNEALSRLQHKALELVGERYSVAGAVASLEIETLNSVRPPSLQYRSRSEVLREFLSQADAIATFAVNLGLITPAQAADFDKAFWANHPELMSEAEE